MTDSATSPAVPQIDADTLRSEFPILHRGPNTSGPLAFLDSAASAMKPRCVIDSLRETYESSYANVHRGVYHHAAAATDRFEQARRTAADFLNAASPREIIFTRGTTEAINLVANSWGRTNLGPGDIVAVSALEHHSNLVPWQQICIATGAELRIIPIHDDGQVDVTHLDEVAAGGNLKMVSVVHVSNSLGSVMPLAPIVAWARREGSLVMVDGAQSVPHRAVDVADLDIDFLAFSGHKAGAPSGVGLLWGREELLAEMPPWQFGGEMIRSVEYQSTTFNDLPWKFEAGTPAIAEVIALGVALEWLQKLDMRAVQLHEAELTAYAHARMSQLEGLKIVGPPANVERGGVISFVMDGTHPHDIATLLDQDDINIRAGHHCTQPLMKRLGIHATARLSFWVYSTQSDVDRFMDGLEQVRKVFGLR